MSASVWEPGEVELVTGANSIEFQRFVASAAQELFTLTEFEYMVGANALQIYKNGLALVLDVDYEEVSTSTFSLVVPATLNDIIYAVGIVGFTDSTAEAVAAAAIAVAAAEAAEAERILAEAAADAAAALLLEFGVQYLGAKAADPTLDNQGNPLIDGALYWNTVVKSFKAYDLATTTWYTPDTPPDVLLASNNLSELIATAATARANLGLEIGTNVQAYNAAAAFLNAVQSWTVAQRNTPVVLTDAATVATDLATSNLFTLTLGGNRTLGNPTNQVAGQVGSIRIAQDGTGSRTLAFASNWKFANGVDPLVSTAASAVDRLDYVVWASGDIHAVLTKAYA